MLQSKLGPTYNPLYFLAALGAGGLAVSFFMYPNFLLAHKGTPLITYAQIQPIMTGGNLSTAIPVGFALFAVAILSLLHFRLLYWNIREYRHFKATKEFAELKNSNREITLMAIPLTLAMSINVAFVLGAVFIPGLWSVVEYLFPVALLAFLAVGIYALKIISEYFTRIITTGNFNFTENNNFTQLLSIFALTMVAVGFAAPGAMSHSQSINAIGMFFSMFFLSLAVLLSVIKIVMGFISILKNGISKAASPSMWISIPILTLMGITIIRLMMGLHHGFETELSKPSFFILTSIILSLEILVGLIGYKVMKQNGYFKEFSNGTDADAGTFALICPGVAFFVFGMFFLIFGLVNNGLVTLLSPVFFLLLLPLIAIQFQTIRVFFRLLCRVTACGPCKAAA